MTLRLSAKEETSNKTCKCCSERLTPEEQENHFDICDLCIMLDAITDQD